MAIIKNSKEHRLKHEMNSKVNYKIKVKNSSIVDSHDTVNIVWNGFAKTSVENDTLSS